MNKELIERLAEGASVAISRKRYGTEAPIVAGWYNTELCANFLAAYLAERGKEAVALPTEEQREAILSTARRSFRHYQSSCRGQQVTESDDPDTHIILATWDMASKLLLATQPAIPEGMVQRNPEPYLICGDIAVSNDPRYAGWVFVRHVNGKDWATGAKLTPETWQMIAAAGVAP